MGRRRAVWPDTARRKSLDVRQARSRARGTQYRGKVCAKHPEGAGLRQRSSWKCVACVNEYRSRQRRLGIYSDRNRIAREALRRSRKVDAAVFLTAAEHLRINALYAEAARRTAETGIVHHVDHDVPIALGGLHHPDNLLVVPAEINLKKGARYASTWDFIAS